MSTFGPSHGLENFPDGMVPVDGVMEQIDFMSVQNANLRHEVDALRENLRSEHKDQLRFVFFNGIARQLDRAYWPGKPPTLFEIMTRINFRHRDNLVIRNFVCDLYIRHVQSVYTTNPQHGQIGVVAYLGEEEGHLHMTFGIENGVYIYTLPAEFGENVPMLLRSPELQVITTNIVNAMILWLETTEGLDFSNVSNFKNGHPFDVHHAPTIVMPRNV